MSGFISSLLFELGLRQALHRPRQPPSQPHASDDPPESVSIHPKTSSSSDPEDHVVVDLGRNCGGQELKSGDAGSLHGSPFFTTLPKEMDRRSMVPESTAPMSSRAIADPGSAHNGVARVGSTNPNLGSAHARPARASESNSQNEHQVTSTLGSQDPSNAFDIDELGALSLPADDGMGVMRRKIHAIRDLKLSNVEKARMVHNLMIENYNSSRQGSTAYLESLPPLSASPPPHTERPVAHGSHRSWPPFGSGLITAALRASASRYENSFSLTAEDLQPTFAPRVEPESTVGETGDEDLVTEGPEEACLGCRHYKRNVKLQCHTCKKWYTCRFCHDEVEDHRLIRRETENMLCMLCGHAQPAAQLCRKCGEQTARYYCGICKLWDNDTKKRIYHCTDCGICRIGQGLGKDFFHCKTCCVCLPISIGKTHRCIERSTQCDCPICGDYMFTSPETVVVMRCGHSIHHRCLSEYSRSSFRCPICSKTITNMESTFRNLDRTIESQPMPAEFKDTKGLIYCNDCGVKSIVKYHWLGLKCDLCESYNTAQIRLLQGDMSESLEEENGVGGVPSRPRSSFNADEESMLSLEVLRLNTSSVPNSHTRDSMSAEADGQFASYNLAHGRAISPVVNNYFGLPSERESEKPPSLPLKPSSLSLPFFRGQSRSEHETEYGTLRYLSKKLRYRYGLLGGDSKAEEISDADSEDDTESSDTEAGGEDEDEEEEEEEDVEYIDIFGHR